MTAKTFDVKESSKPVTSVENFEDSLTKHAHDWHRDGVVDPYEIRTRSESFLSIFEICPRCYVMAYARLNDFTEHDFLHRVRQRFLGVNVSEAPTAGVPDGEGCASK